MLKVNFKLRNCISGVTALLLLVGFIGACVSNATYAYPLTGFAFIVVAFVIGLLISVTNVLGLIKSGWIKDALIVLSAVCLIVSVGLIIYSRGYAYGMTVFTKAEADNPYLVRSYETGVFALIFYVLATVSAIVYAFVKDVKKD